MNFKKISTAIFVSVVFAQAFSQNPTQTARASIKDPVSDNKFSVSTTYLTFLNFGEEKTNTHHYEFHLGYHIPLFKNRMYIEPQIHCNYWPIDTKAPQSFQEEESKWNNYFLFEPNLFIGINF